MIAYACQYANGGLKFLNVIACQDLFKNYYELEPSQLTSYLAIIWLPWGVKFLYGVMADSIPIFGSRKKSWLVLMGFVQVISLILSATIHFTNVQWFVFLQIVTSIAGAFMDVIVDALMVMQAKRDPEQGSQDLQSFAWMILGIAAISGGLVGAFMTGYVNPYWCFGYYAIFGVFVIISSWCLNPFLEFESDFDLAMSMTVNGVHVGRKRTFCEELKHNYHIVKHEFKMKLFQRTMLFYILVGVTHCRYDDFMYYYKLNVLGFTQFQYACLLTGGSVAMTLGVILYQRFMTEWETRTVVRMTIMLMALNALSGLALTLRWNI